MKFKYHTMYYIYVYTHIHTHTHTHTHALHIKTVEQFSPYGAGIPQIGMYAI